MRLFALLLALVASAASAQEARYCAVAEDGAISGCWNLDPKIYPPPEGTRYVADPERRGSPGQTYDTRLGFIEPPVESSPPSDGERIDALMAEIEELKTLMEKRQ